MSSFPTKNSVNPASEVTPSGRYPGGVLLCSLFHYGINFSHRPDVFVFETRSGNSCARERERKKTFIVYDGCINDPNFQKFCQEWLHCIARV